MKKSSAKSITKSREQYEARAKVAKSLGHPSRLLILDLLVHRERCVQDLTEQIGCDQSTVSKHLSVLKDSGLVQSRRDGTSQYYFVTCGCLDGFFQCLENVVQSDAQKRSAAAGKDGCSR